MLRRLKGKDRQPLRNKRAAKPPSKQSIASGVVVISLALVLLTERKNRPKQAMQLLEI